MFELDPRLAADTAPVTDLPLSRVVLVKDARYPWLILVPRIPGAREMHLLAPREIQQLALEMTTVASVLESVTGGHKMNIGALGNVVSQLHIHIIARFREDPAWPAPVWGMGEAEPYEDTVMAGLIASVESQLSLVFLPPNPAYSGGS